MSLIDISNLTFAYEGSSDDIFKNVSFQIDTDWKLGFTGRNGRGKTTFLNLLLGKYEYKGKISSSVDFDYFPFEIYNKEEITENIVESICGCENIWRLKKELFMMDVDEDVIFRPFETLSNGEQTKVMLAALFIKENNFLLIDEPTNHLDTHARKIVGRYLKSKKGFILVSHDRAFLDECIDHILSINKTNIQIQNGNFSSWIENKKRQDLFEINENEKLKKDIKRLEAASKTAAVWSDKVEKTKFGHKNSGIKPDKGYIGHKAAKMMKRSKNIQDRQERAVAEKSKLLKNIESYDNLAVSPIEHHKKILIEFKNISIFYGNKTVFKNISFDLQKGERIALTGKNGCGKSSILKLIIGENISYSGTFTTAAGLIISYVPQDASFLKGSLKEYINKNKIDEVLFKAILRKLDFTRAQFEKNIDDYSSGQKKKVLIAKSLCEKAHLYIWDEPLNYIDIFSRMQIENLIINHNPTMIFVEHDICFINNIATKQVKIK